VTTGVRPDGTVLTPHMPYAYYKFWNMDDLKAVYTYMKTVPPTKRTVPRPKYESDLSTLSSADRGAVLFRGRCQTCHGEHGKGTPATNVVLAEVAGSLNDTDLLDFVKAGEMDLRMPGFGKTFTDEQFSDLVAFIRTWEQHQ